MIPEQQPPENRSTEPKQVIPVIEERIVVDKQVVETGSVRVSKRVSEEEKTFEIPVLSEEYSVERVPVNQYIETPPEAVRYEGDTMILPVLQEVVVVEKRLLLVEEIRISKNQKMTSASQQVTLRREEVIVDRIPVSGNPTVGISRQDATGSDNQ
ncbi:YsnF/AvaK domain-containing protein [Larkinella soli]|uniref:YsnF/AvaK domain-containing protein n=1 Tax=Larkinella soli TaxID=1770527 RepID=UPI000FFCC52C|nr:YsnF/AvaK domain-containing protein [Larkinella soli]